MSAQTLRERLKSGQCLLGLCNMYPASGLIEGMCAGWDLVWIDAQHGQIGYDAALAGIRTAEACGLETLLRVPGHEPSMLGVFADLAPSALMVPMVNTPEQARSIVTALRFAPQGQRSYGGRRPIDLGGRQYFKSPDPILVAQIETIEAAQNAEAIIDVDGTDMLFFGPDDMKVSMGIAIDTPPTEHARLRQVMAATAQAARRAGKSCACIATTDAAARIVVEMGYQLLIGGGDAAFVRTGAAQRLQVLRDIVRPQPSTSADAAPRRFDSSY